MFDVIPADVFTDDVTGDVLGAGVADGVGDAESAAGRRPPVTAAPLLDAFGEAFAVAVALGAIDTVELATGAGLVDGDAEPDDEADGETVGLACGLP